MTPQPRRRGSPADEPDKGPRSGGPGKAAAALDAAAVVPLILSVSLRAGRGQDPSAPGALAVAREARRQGGEAQGPSSIDRIVTAAQALLLEPGAGSVSVKDVCREARVSRGTLYRYFGSMEEIVQAVALRLRDETDRAMRRAVEAGAGPDEQFEAFLSYMMCNQEALHVARLIRLQPLFVLNHLRSNFQHFVDRVVGIMAAVFDAWDARLGAPLDREAISEMMVRYVLSELVAPTPPGAPPLPMRLRSLVAAMVGHGAVDAPAAPAPQRVRPKGERLRRQGAPRC